MPANPAVACKALWHCVVRGNCTVNMVSCCARAHCCKAVHTAQGCEAAPLLCYTSSSCCALLGSACTAHPPSASACAHITRRTAPVITAALLTAFGGCAARLRGALGLPAGTALAGGAGWLLRLSRQRLLPLLEALRVQQPLHQLLQARSICQVQVGDLQQQWRTVGPAGSARHRNIYRQAG